ncbi:hypothetical protein C8F01DRAFT_1275585 [Mycena amicta]|nr:hypothetical protein C8F01DRAFT_1275585 [Mycena amicta]
MVASGTRRHGVSAGDSNTSAAALWVLWFFESKETLSAERDIVRQNIMALVLPFVVAPFRYASALAPPHHYTIPLLPAVRARLAANFERRWVAGGNQGPMPVGPTQADLVEKNTGPIVRFERQVVPIASTSSLEDAWAVDPADAIHEDEETER